MNKLAKLPTDITRSRGLALILTADKARAGMTELIANLILNGPLFVISASEWLPAYELTRTLHKKTLEVRETLNRLYTVRTSTCYRLLDSLVNIPARGEPVFVLDFLHTFYDSDIPLRVRFHKLRECCRLLKHLALYRPVVVMTQELSIEEYAKFAPALFSIADKTFTIEPELEQISQATLF